MAAAKGFVVDQMADEQFEETKVSTVIKQNGEGSVSGTKEVAGKDEEGKLGIGSVEETEVKNSDTAVQANKVEENDQGFDSDVLATDELEVLKDPRREYADLTPQSAVEDYGEELKNKRYLSDTHEPPSKAKDKSMDDLIPSIVQEPGSEAAKEPAFSESMTEELKSEEREISDAPSLVSDTESKPVEPPVVTAVTEPAFVFETPIAAEEISAAPNSVSGKESKPVELPTVSVEPASSVIEIPTAVKEISASPGLVSDTESNPLEPPIVSAVIEPASKFIETPIAVEAISAARSSVTDTAIEQMEPPTVSANIEPASNVIETPLALESSAISQDENSLVQVEAIIESKKEEVADLAKLDVENKNGQETVASGTTEVELDETREVDIPDAFDKLEPEKTRADHDADAGMEKYVENSEGNEMEKLTTEIAFDSVLPTPAAVALTECIADPQFTVEEEKQEKTIEVEETSSNETIACEVADISSEGKMASRGIGMVAGKLQESLEGSKTTVVMTSEDLESAKTILEVPPKNERSSGGIEISKEKNDNSFEDEKFSSVETSRCHDAIVEVDEVSLSEIANASEEVGTGEEKKDESLEGVESTLIETSKDVVPTTQVAEVSYEAEKASKIVERAEDQGESLGGELITSSKTTKYLLKRATTKYYDAEDAELSSAEDGIVSNYVEMVEEYTKSYESENRTSNDTSKDLDLYHATEVAEFSTEVEKTSKTVERNTEDVSFETDKATLVGTSKDLHAAEVPEVLFEEEKASRNVEMDKGNNETLEGDKEMILSGTSEEANATTNVAEAPSEVEKDSGRSATVRGKDENLEDDKKQTLVETSKVQDAAFEFPEVSSKGEKVSGSTEERGERSLGSDGTTIGATKECNVEENVVVATPAKEPIGGADEVESEFKPSEVIQTIKDGAEIEGSGVKKEEVKESEGQIPTISSKNGGDTAEKEAPEQVLIKSVERRSGRMISKVKKSIVKVKKAIFGKSPRSKTIASEG